MVTERHADDRMRAPDRTTGARLAFLRVLCWILSFSYKSASSSFRRMSCVPRMSRSLITCTFFRAHNHRKMIHEFPAEVEKRDARMQAHSLLSCRLSERFRAFPQKTSSQHKDKLSCYRSCLLKRIEPLLSLPLSYTRFPVKTSADGSSTPCFTGVVYAVDETSHFNVRLRRDIDAFVRIFGVPGARVDESENQPASPGRTPSSA